MERKKEGKERQKGEKERRKKEMKERTVEKDGKARKKEIQRKGDQSKILIIEGYPKKYIISFKY